MNTHLESLLASKLMLLFIQMNSIHDMELKKLLPQLEEETTRKEIINQLIEMEFLIIDETIFCYQYKRPSITIITLPHGVKD
ncbi:hypothetical protein V6B33_05040 [Mangrovibacillus sp. Mu-81]|uniref:hypothetical protein n=1 Tax=Mangrovibacillus sp. Mu-81 TaxID=3121478 RepID=UPI002FE4B36D